MDFILASASPRRKDLLEQLGIKAKVIPSEFAETLICQDVYELLKNNTLGKISEVVIRVADDSKVIIAADTVVMIDKEILGKPADFSQATVMLTKLSGREHSVLTGLAIAYAGEISYEVSETTVKFKTLSKQEIHSYLNTGEGQDKAGSYAIQGLGAVFVESIIGCYNNVVGLPTNLLYTMLATRKIQIPKLS